MTDSALLGLPYIDAAQSQKHVTHNEALARLDLSVQIALTAMNVVTPPLSPAEGARVHVGAGATGLFAGHDGEIAAVQDGVWRFLLPRAGWIVWVSGTQDLLIYDGAVWQGVASAIDELHNLQKLGLGTSADSVNPLSAKLNGVLLTARQTSEGGTGDLRISLNKQASAGTLSQIFQTNYSARAETGLMADDHYRVKVSPNGSAWSDAIDIDPATGIVSCPAGISAPGLGLSLKRVETFTSSGTFTRQAIDVLYFIIMVGGGGGGGAGRRSATAVQAGGGAGGNGGARIEALVRADEITPTVAVGIGAGGGAAAAAADNANGANGGDGGTTTFGTYLLAQGGKGGGGGTNTAAGAVGAAQVNSLDVAHDSFPPATTKAGAGGVSAAGLMGNFSSNGAGGGGGGAGISAANAVAAGGLGAIGGYHLGSNGRTGAGAAGTSGGGNGGTGAAPSVNGGYGAGGGGGGSSVTGASGNGGPGGTAGGGGGGGAGGRNTFSGGAGGAGGAGRLQVFVYG